jgi:hypothetical protein
MSATCFVDVSGWWGSAPNTVFMDIQVAAQAGIATLSAPCVNPPTDYSLTVGQGTQIAMAIALLWAVGATFRIIINFLKSKDGNEND